VTRRPEIEYRFCPQCGAGLALRSLKTGEPDRLVCGDCTFVFYLDPKVAAGVIVPYEGKVILLKRGIEPRLGSWVFPGGFVDRGEHPEQAAIREAREEAGIEVALRGLIGVYHEPPGSPIVLVVYHGEWRSGTPSADDESLEVGLFSPAEIPWPELGFPTTRAALRDYVAGLGLDGSIE
jgi:ADP-ribose pyrophosphatase YjhB (NUDIX family)